MLRFFLPFLLSGLALPAQAQAPVANGGQPALPAASDTIVVSPPPANGNGLSNGQSNGNNKANASSRLPSVQIPSVQILPPNAANGARQMPPPVALPAPAPVPAATPAPAPAPEAVTKPEPAPAVTPPYTPTLSDLGRSLRHYFTEEELSLLFQYMKESVMASFKDEEVNLPPDLAFKLEILLVRMKKESDHYMDNLIQQLEDDLKNNLKNKLKETLTPPPIKDQPYNPWLKFPWK